MNKRYIDQRLKSDDDSRNVRHGYVSNPFRKGNFYEGFSLGYEYGYYNSFGTITHECFTGFGASLYTIHIDLNVNLDIIGYKYWL